VNTSAAYEEFLAKYNYLFTLEFIYLIKCLSWSFAKINNLKFINKHQLNKFTGLNKYKSKHQMSQTHYKRNTLASFTVIPYTLHVSLKSKSHNLNTSLTAVAPVRSQASFLMGFMVNEVAVGHVFSWGTAGGFLL